MLSPARRGGACARPIAMSRRKQETSSPSGRAEDPPLRRGGVRSRPMSFAKPVTGETDYERYIRTQELLALQKKNSDLVNHDELLFQSIHQSMEIWFKVAIFELDK